jgi:hypothetical protein
VGHPARRRTECGFSVGLWDTGLTSGTVAWFIGTGLALFGKSINAFKPGGSFKRVIVATLGLTVLVEGFVNLYVFSVSG